MTRKKDDIFPSFASVQRTNDLLKSFSTLKTIKLHSTFIDNLCFLFY